MQDRLVGRQLGSYLIQARIAAEPHQPNIVQIYDAGQSEGIYFIVMELAEGPVMPSTFRDGDDQGRFRSGTNQRIDVAMAVSWTPPICRGSTGLDVFEVIKIYSGGHVSPS